MDTLNTEGVVLRAIAYREYDRILTLLTPEGLLKLFVKGTKRTLLRLTPLVTPLTRAEYHFTKGKGELYRFQDGTVLSQNLPLRERYENLEAAHQMSEAILTSQWPGKQTPHLYHLFCLFLDKIPKVAAPEQLVSVFRLKTLIHEGMLQLSSQCSLCDASPVSRFGGERYCRAHAPRQEVEFSSQEEALLQKVSLSRSFDEVCSKEINSDFQLKIRRLFEQAFSE